ncbi:hypothetical protein CISIN_1g047735mg [Citrus sinensis]|uniref:Secreted protein n=1 Tax=Citrus sinensis TaxID=2711 RepID=A0A067D464_CITSI|nr:hypothetical protein CISIN_1g047735mg [Citrus sinensis]
MPVSQVVPVLSLLFILNSDSTNQVSSIWIIWGRPLAFARFRESKMRLNPEGCARGLSEIPFQCENKITRARAHKKREIISHIFLNDTCIKHATIFFKYITHMS